MTPAQVAAFKWLCETNPTFRAHVQVMLDDAKRLVHLYRQMEPMLVDPEIGPDASRNPAPLS